MGDFQRRLIIVLSMVVTRMTMSALQDFSDRTFSSLKIRNFRLYFIGQVISCIGSFMQSIAQPWLVLQLTDSGTAIGLVFALQYLPVLLLAPWGGLIADRFPKRKLIFLTQAALGLLALGLGVLVALGNVQLWMVYAFALLFGLVTTVDTPARQAFIVEMVGKGELKNAVTLNNGQLNLARVIGPAVAGVLISTVGLMTCFVLNGISFGAVLLVLMMMDARELSPAPPVSRAKGQVTESFRYVLSSPVLRNTLIMVAIVGTLTYEYGVSLPMVAQFTFGGGAGAYAELSSALGLGAIIGGLFIAGQKMTSPSALAAASLLFGMSMMLASAAPGLPLMVLALVVVGAFSIYFITLGTTILQLESKPGMSGRVLAFWSMAYLGSTTIGAPAIGWVGETFGPRWGLAVGGVAAIVAAGIGYITLRQKIDIRIDGDEAAVAEEEAEGDRRMP